MAKVRPGSAINTVEATTIAPVSAPVKVVVETNYADMTEDQIMDLEIPDDQKMLILIEREKQLKLIEQLGLTKEEIPAPEVHEAKIIPIETPIETKVEVEEEATVEEIIADHKSTQEVLEDLNVKMAESISNGTLFNIEQLGVTKIDLTAHKQGIIDLMQVQKAYFTVLEVTEAFTSFGVTIADNYTEIEFAPKLPLAAGTSFVSTYGVCTTNVTAESESVTLFNLFKEMCEELKVAPLERVFKFKDVMEAFTDALLIDRENPLREVARLMLEEEFPDTTIENGDFTISSIPDSVTYCLKVTIQGQLASLIRSGK